LLDFKVAFALLLYDEFDGSAITDASVLFRCDGRIVTPLRKKEGFYVFRGLDQPEIELEISRPHYHTKNKRVIKNCLDPGYPVERERLLRQYPGRFSDCEWLHGDCPPNSEVLAFSEDEQARLQAGDDGKNQLTILGCAAGRLVGRRLALEKKSGETFLLTRMAAPGVYLTDRELASAPKGAWPVIRAYLSQSGSDGRYHIPVERGVSGRPTDLAYRGRGKENGFMRL